MVMLLFVSFLALVSCNFAELKSSLPVSVPAVVVEDGKCPSVQARDGLQRQVDSLLQNTVNPALDLRASCPCGGRGDWARIAFLDMSDPSVQCPSNWGLIETPVRGCRRLTPTGAACDSVFFSSNGCNYSRVCGKVIGYQQGSTGAFLANFLRSSPSLDNAYLDGVSITHGSLNQRQHIWSFAVGLNEVENRRENCPCVNVSSTSTVPVFVGDNYFCESGNPTSVNRLDRVFTNDPLWDGDGCGPTTSCCKKNNPPQFCTTLPQATTDDIEVRICLDESTNNENVIISLVDIHVM